MARKTFSPQFEFQAVLEALRASDKTDAEIARQYDVHPVTFATWKRQLLEQGPTVFGQNDKTVAELEKKIADLERVLGQKEVELALLRNFAPRR